jgi:DNA adenine methylase
VALGLHPQLALLNDHNEHLINFYRWLQRGLVIDLPMRNLREEFLAKRARFNLLAVERKSESREAAELFYYLNRTCYNGLCRFNRLGRFNVPFGRYQTIHYVHDFRNYSSTLKKWKFCFGDFASLELRHKDFVYADPPYDVDFTSYSYDGFSWTDQERLAEWLSRHRGPVIASNQKTERIVALYQRLGFHIITLEAPRRIACNGDRTPALEILAVKGQD